MLLTAKLRCLTRTLLTLGTTAHVASCGFWDAFQRERHGGYDYDYNERANNVVITINEERLAKMGGPYSEDTKAFVEEVVKREQYCKGGRFIPEGPRRAPHGVFWVFMGFCRPPG